jgi:transmembrane sensor
MELMNRERTLQEAARRYARLHADDCSQEERDSITSWQAESPANREAFERAERVGSGVAALADDPRFRDKLRAMADEALAARVARPPISRRWRMGAGLAASLAVALLAWHGLPRSESKLSTQAMVYESAGLERRSVKLEDGSMVELDVDTRISIHMSAARRQIELLSGRAMFDVAHDASRPFSVTAAGSRTTALGTRFQVRREDDNVVVTLAEGSVAVDRDAGSLHSSGWSERLSPGEQISIDTVTQRRQRQVVDVNMTLSWMSGRHIFRGTPLSVAIDEVNRYATRKIRLGDATLGDLRVGGNFIVGDSDVIVDAFAAVLPLRAVDNGDSEILLFRRPGQ